MLCPCKTEGHTMVNQTKKKPLGGKITIFGIRGISCFTAFSFPEEHVYLHHQQEARSRCHWSRTCSAGSELAPGCRICRGCCAACAGPSRRSRGRRNCTRRSCSAARRRAVPAGERQSLSQARLGSPVIQNCVSRLLMLFTKHLHLHNFPLYVHFPATLLQFSPESLSLCGHFQSVSAKKRNPL